MILGIISLSWRAGYWQVVKCAVFDGSMWQSEKLLLYPRDGLRGQWRSSGCSHPDHFPRSLFEAVPREVAAGGHRAQDCSHPWSGISFLGPTWAGHHSALAPPAPAPTAPSSHGWSRSLRNGCSFLGVSVKVNPGESGTEQAGSALPSCCCGVALPAAGKGSSCAHSSGFLPVQMCVPRAGCASQGHPLPGAVLGSAGGSGSTKTKQKNPNQTKNLKANQTPKQPKLTKTNPQKNSSQTKTPSKVNQAPKQNKQMQENPHKKSQTKLKSLTKNNQPKPNQPKLQSYQSNTWCTEIFGNF